MLVSKKLMVTSLPVSTSVRDIAQSVVAKVAGISGAKRTSDLIPLCHNIAIDKVDLRFSIVEDGVEIKSHAICTDKTGIEMEAMTAVCIAALTIYDMCKAVDPSIVITDVRLLEKTKREIDDEA